MARLNIDIVGKNSQFLAAVREAEKYIDRLTTKAKSLGKVGINISTGTTISNLNKLNSTLDRVDKNLRQIARTSASIRPPNLTPVGGGGVSGPNGIANLTSGYLSLYTAISAVREVFQTSIKTDALATSFGFVIDDSTQRLEALRIQANRLGVDYLTLAETNKKFIAAANASNFELDKADKIFNSVANAGAKLKLSNEQIGGTFLALEQMISKGTVSMEELRRQLGDRLPGAFALAAKALGVTEPQLNKMIRQGEVLAKDLLPLLADELDKVYGNSTVEKIESLQASTNRLKNTFVEWVQGSQVTDFFKLVIDGSNTLARAFLGLNNETSTAVSKYTELNKTFASNSEKLSSLIPRYKELSDGSKQSANESDELKSIINEIANIIPEAVTEWDKYGNALGVNINKVNSMTEAQKRLMATLNEDAIFSVRVDASGLEQRARYLNDLIKDFTEASKQGRELIALDKDNKGQQLTFDATRKQLDKVNAELAQMYLKIESLGGVLSEDKVNLLKQLGLREAPKELKTIEQALKAISSAGSLKALSGIEDTFAQFLGNKTFEDAIEKRTKELSNLGKKAEETAKNVSKLSESLQGIAQSSKNRLDIAIRSGLDADDEATKQKFDALYDKAKETYDGIVAITQASSKERINAEKDFSDFIATNEQERANEHAKNAEKYKESEKEVADFVFQYQRRLNESLSQQLIRRLNDEYKIKVKAAKNDNDALIKLQNEYWDEVERISKKEREIGIQAAFDGNIGSVELAKIADEMQELKRQLEADSISITAFQMGVLELNSARESVELFAKSFNTLEGAVGDAFAEIIIGGENVGDTLKNIFKSAVNSIIKDLARLAAQKIFRNILSVGVSALGGGGLLSGLLKFVRPLAGFSSGGYTGGVSPRDITGFVHGGEYVINAKETRDHYGLLSAINSGKSIAVSGGSTVNITPVVGFSMGEIVFQIRKEIKRQERNG